MQQDQYSLLPVLLRPNRIDLAGKSNQQPNQPANRKARKTSPGDLLRTPAVKVTLGLLVGIGLLFLVSRFVNVPTILAVLHKNLTTPRGIILALLSGVAFLLAWSIRGIRWKLFVNPIGKLSILKAIQLYQVGVFLNFLLPIRGGEVVKCFMLKRSTGIAVSKSLSTVAMDKALDLMPALFIMAMVPLLGIRVDIKLWVVLAFVSGILVSLLCFVVLAAWKRDTAIGLLQKLTGLLPQAIAGKIEGFATGFVDSLLMGARQPRIFLPAILLTCVAVICDGLFAMLAFWTIGFPISFGTAIFGYAVYNMFYILPTPPGQVGSNEAVGLLVFAGLLHLPANQVTAMFFFSHPWAALLMCTTGLACLSALGVTIAGVIRVRTSEDDVVPAIPMSKGEAVERAMSLDAQHRFSSVEQSWEALRRLEEQAAPVSGSDEEEDPTTVRLPKPPPGVRVPASDEEEDPTATVRLPKPPSIAPAGVKEPDDLEVATHIPQF
jgi:uncharacterized protein (TIRG00374 family)